MKKEKPVLKLKGGLILTGKENMPRPGKATFRIQGMADGAGKILMERELSIRSDMLPEVLTSKHIYGTVEVTFFETVPNNTVYEAAVAAEASRRTRIPKSTKKKARAN